MYLSLPPSIETLPFKFITDSLVASFCRGSGIAGHPAFPMPSLFCLSLTTTPWGWVRTELVLRSSGSDQSWDSALGVLAPSPVLFPLYLILTSLTAGSIPPPALTQHLGPAVQVLWDLEQVLSEPQFLYLITGAKKAPVSISQGYGTSYKMLQMKL